MGEARPDAGDLDDIEGYLQAHQKKELLRFVSVGSVDDGKSTLIGRLLHDTQGIFEDQLASMRRVAKPGLRGDTPHPGGAPEGIDFSLLTDGLRAEREQGITIDVAYRYFSTRRRKFIIADTPGHVQYTRNMATGASTADVALILIDAKVGVLQQSRRHAYIASLLGIAHLAVCVNKMDLVGFDRGMYDAICEEFAAFAAALRFRQVRFFPISALAGDNVVTPSQHTPWHPRTPDLGGTLLEYLETVPIAAESDDQAFRFPVQYVLRPDASYRGFCGAIASGVVRKGDEVMVLPSGKVSTVAAIDVYEGEIDEAFAPMSITLRLADEIDVSRGDMLVHPGNGGAAAGRFEADLVWMSDEPLDPTRSLRLKHTTRMVRAMVEHVESRVDLERLEDVPTDTLRLNDIGRVVITSNQTLFVDPYVTHRETGAFILVDDLTNDTVAAGMVRRPLQSTSRVRVPDAASRVSEAARTERLGQRGVLLWFEAEPSAGQATLAYALEERLFAAGLVPTVVDVSLVADGSRSPELVADLAAQCVGAGLVTILSGGLPRAVDREALRRRIAPERRLPMGGDEPGVDARDPEAVARAVLAELRARGWLDRSASEG